MNVISLEQPAADSLELERLAKGAGITLAQARAFVAMMADTPIRQAIRICKMAHADRIRQINRETRRSERR